MTKRRRPWALMGLVGLGGLLMMGAARPEDDEEDEDDGGSSGGGSGGPGGGGSDGPGSGGSGGGGSDGPDDDHPYGDLPPPPEPFPDPDEDDPPEWKGKHIGGRGKGGGSKPEPKPGTTDGPKPPIDTPDDDEDEDDEDDDPTRVPPEPELDPPWSDLVITYPRGGGFYPVEEGDRFGGTSSTRSIAYRYLLSEAYAAALEVGELVHDEAVAWALAVAKQDKLRLRVIDLIQCSGWNDAMYGTHPVQQSHASQHGRSIRLWPVHGPTEELLAEGLMPFRNATMNGNPADGDFRHYELLWLPAIDRAVLWESGGHAITTTGMEWDDGTSMENPPPWVMALGMDDKSGALVGSFGCPGSDGELEVG